MAARVVKKLFVVHGTVTDIQGKGVAATSVRLCGVSAFVTGSG